MLSNNGYFSSVDFGEVYATPTTAMKPSSFVEDQYDFAMTEDVIMLLERKDTGEQLFKIWQESPYAKQFPQQTSGITAPKIPKEHVQEVFYYMKNKLTEIKTLSAQELVIGICEFFEFNYDFIVKKILSPKMKAELIEEYYNNGMKERIDNNTSSKLF